MALVPWHLRGPLVVEEVLTAQLCNDLLPHFKSSDERPRSYQGIVDKSQRDCALVEVPYELADFVTQAVNQHVDKYFGIESIPVAGQSLLIYGYGQGV
ncbi:MAG: hypothetical protein JO211_03265, partial [Acidobacteriaceae bacterium]|nr:hypothetical protein [Acidobacteriaceae bacterium]